jgi:ssDNA-binding Zn-finger/Zn-ribbon topoisomerase 1
MGMSFSGDLSPEDFDITSYYKVECPECGKDIIEEDHPLDLDFVKCDYCGCNFKIKIEE